MLYNNHICHLLYVFRVQPIEVKWIYVLLYLKLFTYPKQALLQRYRKWTTQFPRENPILSHSFKSHI